MKLAMTSHGEVADEAELLWPDEAELHERIARIPGRSVLDLAPDAMQFYSCGTFALVERDIVATLPEQAAHVLDLLVRLRVPEAFALRNEVVNLKKASYYVHQAREPFSAPDCMAC
jgi:hypothetical protein